MSDWLPSLPLDPKDAQPLYLQIARGLAMAITEGRLKPGEALPGTRLLAAHLDVNRNTVVASYQELHAEGWIQARPGGGTFVADQPPAGPGDRSHAPATRPGFTVNPPPGPTTGAPPQSTPLSCLTTEVDPRLLPMAALSRAYQRALRSRDRSLFAGSPLLGLPRFREALARMLGSTKALAVTPTDVLVTSGLTEALALLSRALLPPGSPIAVEHLGSPSHWETLRHLGHPLLPIPVGPTGASPEGAAQALDQGARMILVTPLRQYPTTVTLAPDRRRALLALARSRQVPILEIDLDPGFQFDGAPALPLAAEDRSGTVIYLGAFSRVLFPSLPLAYLAVPPGLTATLSAWRTTLGASGDPFLQRALTELLEDGELNRHLNRLRRTCLERREYLAEALTRHLQEHLDVVPPSGGLAFWLPTRNPQLDVDAWSSRARALGTAFQAGGEFTLDRSALAALRIGFAGRSVSELEEAVQRLAKAF